MVKKVLHYYDNIRRAASVHLCGLFLNGKCEYMSKESRSVRRHLPCHRDNKLSVVKIVDYPGPRDSMLHEYITKSYCHLNKHDSDLQIGFSVFTTIEAKSKKRMSTCVDCAFDANASIFLPMPRK